MQLIGSSCAQCAVVFQSHLVYFDRERLAVWNLRKGPECEFAIPTRTVIGLFLTRDAILFRTVVAFMPKIPAHRNNPVALLIFFPSICPSGVVSGCCAHLGQQHGDD